MLKCPFAYYSAISSEPISKVVPGVGLVDEYITYGSAYSIGLWYTVNPEAKSSLADARIEYFKIHNYSDLGPIEDIITCIGANTTGYLNPPSTFSFARNDWFNTTAVPSGGVFYANFNGTLPSGDTDKALGGVGGGH